MPKLAEFNAYATDYTIRVKAAGAISVSAALDEGASYMREYISEGSPTTSSWHEQKNAINGYPFGSRIGNSDPGIGPVHGDAGNMFRSVQAEDARVTNSSISGKFGWISNQEEYFQQQDSGSYGIGKKVGMGLINSASGGGKTLQDLGAAVAAEEKLRSVAGANGFRISGGGSWSNGS